MSKKKIEPTDAMVDWAANILCLDATHTSLRFHAGLAQQAYRKKARAVMRTALSLALNHPDAAGLFECDHTDYVHVDEAAARVEAAREHYTADDLRDTPAGRGLMAETWSKFQEHYATEWEEAYPEDVFPSPAPAPAVVSRESVAASMMRQWAKNLRSDRNPFEEDDA